MVWSMYITKGIDAVATITEVRSSTSELLEHVRETRRAILIQKNNEPHAVLLDWQTYLELVGRQDKEALPEGNPPS